MRQTLVQITATSLVKIYSAVTALVTLVLTARWLGPGGRGIIAVATTWVGLFSTIGHLSLGQVVLHRAATSRDRPWLGPAFGTLLLLTALISAAGWLLAGGLYIGSGGRVFGEVAPVLLVVAFLGLPSGLWDRFGSSLLLAVDRLHIHNRALFMGRTAGVVLTAVALWLGFGALGVLVALLVSQLVVSGAGMRYLYEQAHGDIRPDRETTKALFGGGLKLHLHAIGTFLIFSADVLLVHHFRGLDEVGQYQFATQLISAALLVPQAASMVLFTKIATVGPDAAWTQQRRVLLLLLLLIAVGATAGAALAPWLVPFLAGNAFRPAVAVLQILLFSLIGMTCATLMTSQWVGRGLFWQSAAVTITVAIFNLSANWVFIPRYGMLAAAWVNLIGSVILIVANLVLAVWIQRRTASAPAVAVA